MIYTKEQGRRDATAYADALASAGRTPLRDHWADAYDYATEQSAEWPAEVTAREQWQGYDR